MLTGWTAIRALAGRGLPGVLLAVLVAVAAGAGLLSAAPEALAAGPASAITAGVGVSCMVRAGQAYCWGGNDFGQLGNNSGAGSSTPVPVYVGGVLAGKTLTRVSAGYGHACALDSAGQTYCWGFNGDGELGDGSETGSNVPVAVDASGVLAGKTLAQISADSDHTCALDTAGAAYCWGVGVSGQLGTNNLAGSFVPVAVDTSGVLSGRTLAQISAGDQHTCAIDTAGVAYCWGYNASGELGDGSPADSDVAVAVVASGVLAGKTLAQISAGSYQTCALDTAGAAYCWGGNANGELGDGLDSGSDVPVAVDTSGVLAGKVLTQISMGTFDTCALDRAGAAFCWGGNFNGELGDGSTAGSNVPVPVDTSGVLTGKVLAAISAGWYATCAVDDSGIGKAYCWGYNTFGQLGNNKTADSDVPVKVKPQSPADVRATGADKTTAVSWADSIGGRNAFMWRWANGATAGMGGCSGGAVGDAFAGAASGGRARTPAAVLGGDRQGNAE